MNDYDDNENKNRETGLVDELPVLSIDVPDRDLINNFKTKILINKIIMIIIKLI